MFVLNYCPTKHLEPRSRLVSAVQDSGIFDASSATATLFRIKRYNVKDDVNYRSILASISKGIYIVYCLHYVAIDQ